jgi:hypothetical protein
MKAIGKFLEDMTAAERVVLPEYKDPLGNYSGPAALAKTWEELLELGKTTTVLLQADPITKDGIIANMGFFVYPKPRQVG